MTRVIAIIVTYNAMKWLDKCIKSLQESSEPVNIIAVDNGSTDGTQKHLKLNYPFVKLIELETNRGFGQANNIGFKEAIKLQAEYLFLLNQDVWIEQNTIKNLIDAHKENKHFGIISPMHWNGTEDGLEIKFNEYINPYDTPDLLSDLIGQKKLKSIYETKFVNAAAWLIYKECVFFVGGFDPLFYHYGEDEDYARRALFKGWKIGITPASRIFHDSDYKTWDMIKANYSRMLIIQFLSLKRMEMPFRSSLLSYYKSSFNRVTDLLLFRKWSDLKFNFRIILSATLKLTKIKKARDESFKKGAFLE